MSLSESRFLAVNPFWSTSFNHYPSDSGFLCVLNRLLRPLSPGVLFRHSVPDTTLESINLLQDWSVSSLLFNVDVRRSPSSFARQVYCLQRTFGTSARVDGNRQSYLHCHFRLSPYPVLVYGALLSDFGSGALSSVPEPTPTYCLILFYTGVTYSFCRLQVRRSQIVPPFRLPLPVTPPDQVDLLRDLGVSTNIRC